ncbi:hypothetical protein NDN08_006002 [Rhodosorus marinus]|uniref:Large ribosomal subunit protein uL15/eL18 domain-containing protein n=1 Tax=Rhodosorus marinus TaxID=101924 RepID=A0AAV8UNB1_9RHOD|nr:hypothetical protein NDN08_006002 [Rhodosorus marinus]
MSLLRTVWSGGTRRESLGVAPRRWFHEVAETELVALDRLRINPGSRKKVLKRRGFGGGSRNYGRGQNTFYKQSGSKLPARFAAGTPYHMQFPKTWANTKPNERTMRAFNLNQIQWLIDTGKLNPNEKITMKKLFDMKQWKPHVNRYPGGMKLTAKGREYFSAKIDIEVPLASYQAAQAILANGGKLTLVYYTRHGLKVHLRPERWTKQNLPVPKPAEPKDAYKFFYTERDENGQAFRYIDRAEDVLYVHPRVALHRTLFKKSISDRLKGVMKEGEEDFQDRLKRAEEQWKLVAEEREKRRIVEIVERQKVAGSEEVPEFGENFDVERDMIQAKVQQVEEELDAEGIKKIDIKIEKKASRKTKSKDSKVEDASKAETERADSEATDSGRAEAPADDQKSLPSDLNLTGATAEPVDDEGSTSKEAPSKQVQKPKTASSPRNPSSGDS